MSIGLLDELLVGLGFDYDPKDITRFKDDLGDTVKVVKKLTQVAIAGAVAITGITLVSTKASDEQGRLADEIGSTTEMVDALGFALERSGGASNSMATSLKALNMRIAEAGRGVGSGLEVFGLLGISTRDGSGRLKNATDMIHEISDAFEDLDRSQQSELAAKLGISSSLDLLRKGSSEIHKLTQEAIALGSVTGEDAFLSREFRESLTDMGRILSHVSRLITRVFAPAITDITLKIKEWWLSNKKLIEDNLPKWIDDAAMAMRLLVIATGAWLSMRLVFHVMALGKAMIALVASGKILTGLMLFIPSLIGIAIAAIALLMQDAKKYFEGGESALGDLIDKFPEWGTEIKLVGSLLANLNNTLTSIIDGWLKLIALKNSFSMENIKDVFKNLPGFVGDVTGLYTTDNQGFLADMRASDAGKRGTSIDKVEININGGADSPEAIGRAVMNELQQADQDLQTSVYQ